MVIQAACPDPDVIRDLLNGSLPESEQSELSSHFDLCSTCQQAFDAEATGPQFLGDVARLCSDADWQQNTPTLDRLLRDIPQQLSDAADEATTATWSTEAVADFLDASENADHIGRLGTYEIVEVIGRGGMGIVLRGIDSRLNRVVAIKVLAPELASNPNARRRFYREGQAAAAVSHDHVVTIHAVDDHERLPYLVMEFVAGESLEECIRRTGALPVESILRMGRQAALGLAAAHEVGLVHRDMKPANILLENGIQRVRITDFGLARAIDDVSMTQTGTVSGTPLYMSPEQAGGESIDHRSDLFSLGSVFYAMCTGRPAFRAQTTLAVIKRVCEDTPRAIRDVNPDIPQWLVDIIDRLMAKQPDDRIQNAAELADLLGNHLAHLQDPENVPAPAGAEAKPAPKRRTLKSLLLAMLMIGGIGLGITEAAGVTNVSEFLGIVLTLKTPEGTLVIEIEDPDVEVSVDGSEVVLSGITKNELRLKPGKYQYRATRNGEPAESEWVTIARDGRTVVRIQQLPPSSSAANASAPPTAISTRATEEAPSDLSLSDIDFEPYMQSMRARQVWVHARFFERKNQLELAALCCTEIRRLYPRSEFVERANAKLAQLEKQGQPIPNAPHIDPSSEFWRQAQTHERQGRLDVAIALCHHIMLTYSDSKYAEIAKQKYEALEDTGPGAAGLAELFWTQTLVYDEEGQPEFAEKLRAAVMKQFPGSLYADLIRKRLNSTEPGRLWTAVLAFEANVPQAAVVCCSEIVKKFPQSSHAGQSRAKIKLWNKSGLPSLEAVGDPAKFLWELALQYRQSGNVETAMLLCSRVPILFPDSLYVSRARDLTEQLRQMASDPAPVASPQTVHAGDDEPTAVEKSAGSEPPNRPSTDGIALLSPIRVRRFLPEKMAPVWFGKWYFRDIPQQLYGQNFAFVSRDGGLLEFDATTVNGRNINQRIWLLIPHQDWDGSQTTSIPAGLDPSLKFATRESLIASGWSGWNDITSEHIRVTLDQPVEQMKWSVFYRDAKPGERYRVRTHWKHTPMLVWGSTQLDGVTVDPQWDQRVARFGPRATVPMSNGSHVFDFAPEVVNGRLYTKRNGNQLETRFRVDRDQKVTIAVYSWTYVTDSSEPDDWRKELRFRTQLAEMGWRHIGELDGRHTNHEQPDAVWILYSKDCKAGEVIALRDHRNQAPIVFSEKTYFEAGPIEVEELSRDQQARIHAEGRLAKLVEEFNAMIESKRFAAAKVIAERAKQDFPNSPVVDAMLQGSRIRQPSVSASSPTTSKAGPPSSRPLGDTPIDESMLQPNFIRLDSSKMKTQFTGRVSEPGVFGTRGPMSFHGEQPVLFFTRKPEERSVGYGLLVGQVPGTNQAGERFELERFDRTGNKIRVVFRQHTQKSDFLAVTNQQGFYVDQATEKFLQSGLLAIENRIKDRLSDGSREQVLSSPFNGAIRSSRQNLGSTLLGSIQQIRHLEVLRPRLSLLTELQRERRKRIEEARTAFREELKWYSEGIAGLKKTAERGGLLLQSEQKTVERGEVGVTNSQQGLVHCTRQEALLHETGSKEYQNLMLQAAQEFKVLYETNREKSAGQFARLWQARCLHDVGEFARASSIYSALLESAPSTDPMLKLLKYRALQFQMSAIIDGQLEDPGVVIELASAWLTAANDRERRSSTGASIIWEQARAMYVAALPKSFDLPYPTPAPVSAGSVLAGRLRKMTRVLLRWPGISTGKFKPQATILSSILQQQFTDDVPYGRQPRRLYFQTPLPTLPPGEYTITASVAVALEQDQPLTKPTAPSTGKPTATPSPEEATTVTGKMSVPISDADAAEFKRVAVLAVVLKPAENEAFGRQSSSPLNIDLSELTTRMGQLEDVNGFPGDPERLKHYLDDLSQTGKKWAMCAALDLENADSKIHAARALAKLADPDTVAVLLIAAKRNAYGIMGSENVTIHSLYQAELKLALEAATGLKLTPPGLTLTYEHRDELPPRTVVHRSELNPEMFRSETDFKRVDDWLRSVYLADSEIPAVPEPAAEGTIPTAKSIHTGLIGRMSIRTLISNGPGRSSTIKHVDPGYIFQYPQGQFFHRDVLPLKQIKDRSFVVNLTGQLDVPRDMVVKIWHAGGGVSHDECGLYVDGALLGVVGDDREKHNIYEVPLLKGRHNVRWELSGGTFRTNILLFQDPETKSYLPIINFGPESISKATADRVVLIQSSRTDWPVSAKPDWLPDSVVIKEPEPAAPGTLP